MKNVIHSGMSSWFIPTALLFSVACTGSLGNSADKDKDPGDDDDDDDSGVRIDDESGKKYAPLLPIEAAMTRLTQSQYINTITDVFGSKIGLRVELDPDEQTELFLSIGASKVGTSEGGVALYQDAAMDIAMQVMDGRASYDWLRDCNPSGLSDPCIETFIRDVGRRLWRRSLSDDEVARYKNVVGADGESAEKLKLGMQFALAGLLQSPNFLYIVSIGEPDPNSDVWRSTSTEMASRLSYFIWNSTPDDALLEAAENGELVDTDSLRGHVARMLDEDRAHDLASRFFGESWFVSKLSPNSKNTSVFPAWTQSLVDRYKNEFSAVLRDVTVDDPHDLRELFTLKHSFADAELSEIYGGLDGAPRQGLGVGRVSLGDDRWGLLTSGAVIAANSPSDRSSPTHRGVFVFEHILCEEIPPPPDNVNNTLVVEGDGKEDLSVRERLDQHSTNPSCAGCHMIFDPVGYTFESYDAIGVFRTTDNGKEIDTEGSLDGETFANVGELANFLQDDARTTHCMAKQLYQYAIGYDLAEGEEGASDGVLEQINDRFGDAGYTWRELVSAVAISPGFRLIAPPKPESEEDQ